MDRNHHENIAFEEDDLTDKEKPTETDDELHNVKMSTNNTSNRLEVSQYVMYKRRWFGMLAIFMLNLSTGLVWLTFNAVPDISAEWLHTGKTQVNLSVSINCLIWLIRVEICDGKHTWRWRTRVHSFMRISLFQVILYFIAYILMSSVSGFIFEKWGIKKAVGPWQSYRAKMLLSDFEIWFLIGEKFNRWTVEAYFRRSYQSDRNGDTLLRLIYQQFRR